MRQIMNFFLTGLVIWLAAKFFPNSVYVAGIGTLAVITFSLYLVQLVIVVACFIMIAFSLFTQNWIGIIIGFFTMIFAEVIAIGILSNQMDGFYVNGFFAQVLLAFAISCFQIPSRSNSD